ncbi:nucleoside hydrolase-like domain-containing protein [Pseudoduganella sp. S-14]|uniref:nucleoside hydrolase-like domain-containing protein n=1 Tax=Pseudoduganella sp. S-14 TaxID=3404065 RepID=UPI003CECBBC1
MAVWGGANTLAQALYRIGQDRTPQQTARLLSKLRDAGGMSRYWRRRPPLARSW